METINIKAADFPFNGYYAAHVLENGHVPGVLSGAELRGNARKYSGWYAQRRNAVSLWAFTEYRVDGDTSIYLPERARLCRVWIDRNREPVRFRLMTD